MTMTKADKQEMTLVFSEALKNFKQIEILERELIMAQLNRIEEQTKKTNGTVLKHTEQLNKLERDLPHSVAACPQNHRVEELWNNRLTEKKMYRITVAVTTFISVIVGIVFAVIQIFEK